MRKVTGGKSDPAPKPTLGIDPKLAEEIRQLDAIISALGSIGCDSRDNSVSRLASAAAPFIRLKVDQALRDKFAVAAVPQAMRESEYCKTPETIALRAYQIADACMAVRKAVGRG